MRALREYTVVKRQKVLRRKTGSRNSESDWAKARLACVEMTEQMLQFGIDIDTGKMSMADCPRLDILPLWIDGTVFIDQSHMRAVPVGGVGHAGSTSSHQWRVAINAETGLLDENGVLPERLSQIKPKYDSYSQGAYAVCLVPSTRRGEDNTPVWLETYNYTGKRCCQSLMLIGDIKISTKMPPRKTACGPASKGRHHTSINTMKKEKNKTLNF